MVEHVIRPINLSWVEMDLSLFTYKMNFGKPKKCVMSSYLIEGPDKYILIDAGVTYDQLTGGYWPKNNEGTKQKQDDMDDIGRGFKMKGGPIAESFEAGLEKLGLNDAGKVLSCAERILSIKPTHSVALHCKGIALLQMRKHEVAKSTLLKAKDASASAPPDPELTFHLACACYGLGQFAEALTYLQHIPADQRSLGARHLLAQCRSAGG